MLEIFYRVIMRTNTGRKLYLRCTDMYANNEKVLCAWEFSNENAIWFNTDTEAERFCKMYFKNFKNYEIEEFKVYI